nr:phospholipase-like protein [Tanacetum cinerariifolium]
VLVVNGENFQERENEWSKKANVILRGLAWSNVTKFEKSDSGSLFGPLSNPNVAPTSSPKEMRQAWFMASVEFIKGLVDQDGLDETICQKSNPMLVEEGDGVLDCEGDALSNPNVALISSPEEMTQVWFMASVEFIKGLVDQDGLDETICQKSNPMLVEEGDGVLDCEGDGVHLLLIKILKKVGK